MEVTAKTAKQLRLTEEEFELIKQKLGRTPNFNELCAFSGMWSEHCSYKNSIKWLKTLPREGGRMLVKAGEENAGLMDIGDGLGVVFMADWLKCLTPGDSIHIVLQNITCLRLTQMNTSPIFFIILMVGDLKNSSMRVTLTGMI